MRDDILLRYAKEIARDYEHQAERERLAQLATDTPFWKRTLGDLSLFAHVTSLLEWLRG